MAVRVDQAGHDQVIPQGPVRGACGHRLDLGARADGGDAAVLDQDGAVRQDGIARRHGQDVVGGEQLAHGLALLVWWLRV